LGDDGVKGGLGGVATALRAVEDRATGLHDRGAKEVVIAATVGSELVWSVWAGQWVPHDREHTWKPTEAAPADSPKIVTFFGSPPKALMFS